MIKRGKKAQITVFMIVGIILLFSSALLFYIRGQVVQGIGTEFVPSVQEVPLEAQPIKVFTEDCMARIAKEGLKKIGQHGGYVEPTNVDFSGSAFLIGMEPTESDGVTLLNEKNIIPYWWYLKTPNTCSGNCRFDTLKPMMRKAESDNSIEMQLDRYVNRELNKCLKNYDDFKVQGFSFKILGNISTDAKITEKEVLVIVDYPIQVIRNGKSTDISAYITRLDVRFKDIYDMATMIAKKEADTAYLETQTMNMIVMYSSPTSMEKLPPVAEYTIDPFEFNVWTRTETQRRIQSYVLQNAMSMLQVDQARNFQRVIMFEPNSENKMKYDQLATGIMDKMILRLDKNYTNIAAKFSYIDWWPVYLNINDKEVLMPQTVSIPIISWLGLNQYVNLYSLSYPVMVELKDPDAYMGEGYTFRFALEENIRYNQPINVSNVTIFQADQGTLICGQNQKHGPQVTIELKDAITKGPVNNSRIMFAFGSEGCHVGITKIDENNKSIITTNLPIGIGEIRASQENYLDHSAQYYSSPTKGKNITIEMMPYKYINVSVFARPLNYQSYKYILPPAIPYSSLSPKEKYIITLTRQENDSQSGYQAYVVGEGPEIGMAKLVPGTYEVRGYLILNDTVRIPAVDKEYGGGLFGSPTKIHLNESVFDSGWQNGGVVLDNETGFFNVPQDKLFGSQKINFYVLRFPLPRTFSSDFDNLPSMEQTGQLTIYSNIYRTELEPEWI